MIVETTCPGCGGPAKKDTDQENTVYCDDKTCNFIGIEPDLDRVPSD